MINQIKKEFLKYTNPSKARHSSRFFKTGKGEYGEGDIFLGITIPQTRDVVKKYYKETPLKDLLYFIQSKYHDYRMFGLLCLVYKYEKAKTEEERKEIYNIYISNTKYINNWDLVDVTAPKIVGEYLKDKERDILYTFAKSKDLWKQRISIISTFTFIRNEDFKDTLAISEILVNHEHDLIHKAVGWMLREVGKKDIDVEEKFLKKYYKTMPRTMLRYAIEKFPEEKRQKYLKGEI
jgi:3-methyladenine DNA glycosylase AlkD